jgi:carbon-monoxide dehydrogenase medium subunit
MQVPSPFEYERATSVDHAIGLLDRLGEGALIVAGGHSLLPMMKLRIANPEYLIDINDLHDELGYITVAGGPATSGGAEPNHVRIGAMVRHCEVLDSADLNRLFPIFADAEWVIADPVVRNRGTVGGSLCQADPAEDLSTVCQVLDAVCVVRGPSGEREIAIDDFEVGPYETSREPNEILIEVRIPLRPNSSSAYAKVERRVGDWAVAAVGSAVTLDGDTISFCRVGLTAVNADHDGLAALRATLVGKPATEETFAEAGRLAAATCEPVTDQRGTAEYKRHLASELTIRTLRTSVERARAASA